ncbi:hypothetical protein JJE66_15235 [Bradyrhizobium diazoefficiens]|uniref:hypothetical protein n=1 Tax=Bradyrhizobium diazoefficiens TaxID=1355477 RepID=UPI00190DC82B|nr:hypothetical protein [Bradyrhizobium diazoefficiens]MBK3662591.1 hypothetical protein [Bradyrhizobium diazoefficiens]
MTDESFSASMDTEARKAALEIIATLVYIKRIAADRLLRSANVPDDLIKRFLKGKDATTGGALSKRQAASLILDELAQTGQDGVVIRNLLKIAADWTAFELAQDEYKARAVVQKAREMVGTLAEADAREKAHRDAKTTTAAARQKADREASLKRESALLLAQFEAHAVEENTQTRGYLLEDLLNRLFVLHGIPILRGFRRNAGAEQIDAAFELEGWHYLVECRWRTKLANIRELDGLYGQLERSGMQTMGLFLSVNGWSDNVVPVMKQNPNKRIILMEGYDLRTVLAQPVDLRRLLKAKLGALNLEAEPYFSVAKTATPSIRRTSGTP